MTSARTALRDAVRAGRFFGARHAAAAGALAEFLVERGAADALRAWFGDAALREMLRRPDPMQRVGEALDRDIARLDALISRQLDAVLHQPRLTRLEGSWRGLAWLTERAEADRVIRIRLLPIRKPELSRDLERAVEFDQSITFRKLHEEEFGIAGGEPYSLLLADFEVRPGPGGGDPVDDISLLGRLAATAAAAFCPILLPASPALLNLDSFGEASAAGDLAAALRAPDRARWRALSTREDTRFLGVVLPRALGRPAWRNDGTRADRFVYRERVAGDADRVWTAPIYAFASNAVRAFRNFRWPGDLRGAEPSAVASGGVVEGLPLERLPSDPPGPPPRPPVELALTDEQERALADANLIAFCGLDALPEASFSALPTLHRPPRMTTEVADANQRLSAQMNNVLCVCRFAHCVKVMGRDMVGAFLSPEEVQFRLMRWIGGYVSGLAGGGDAAARYPLRDARVEVREQPGRPGTYGCVVHLQPHHQLDDVGAVFRLVTDLSGPKPA
ncbi:type VI secretion system contractile sheath large subunit [Roseomonas sp. CCTCC AB2023176]|uniref:type VI secretion system contractile sheath large subunit n=1 Tax=Roseomonas sp. CCTCC AB2023176 TaxID=3342640 RepID=UPI0035D97101